VAKKNTYQLRLELTPSSQPTQVHLVSDLITPENEHIWRQYLDTLLDDALRRETMDTPEFKAAEEAAKKKVVAKQREAENREREHRLRAMQKPRIDYIPKGFDVDYEQAYAVFLQQEVMYEPQDSVEFLKILQLIGHWSAKSVPQILAKNRPDAAYAVAISVCRHLPTLLDREDLSEYIRSNEQRIRRLIVSAFMALHDSVIAWNNEVKRCYVNDFISEQIRYYKTKFSYISASLLKQKIETPFVGEPVSVKRQKCDEEISAKQNVAPTSHETLPKVEKPSVISINPEYEQNIFNGRWIGIDGDLLNFLLIPETERIEKLLDDGEQMTAATLAMQLIKSLCIHFVEDEHWCYFDDLYSPEFTISHMLDCFNAAYDAGKLSPKVTEYLHTAWQVILQMESRTSYGIPATDLKM
jgi:hypothetical protein